MSENRKTFRVRCPHCERSFQVRYGRQDVQPDSSGKAVVVVDCLHCGQSSAIEIPDTCVTPDVMIRGVVTDQQSTRRSMDDDAGNTGE